MKWKEGRRSYDQEKPDSYELETESVKISVHRHIHHDPDTWLISCYDVRIVQRELKSKIDLHARNEALKMVKNKLKSMLDSLI